MHTTTHPFQPTHPSLLSKYDSSGPRYTSYPAAPYWTRTPSEGEWIESLGDALDADGNKAGLYIHLPFCRSLCTYCGCHKRISRNPEVSRPYVEHVLMEWGIYQKHLKRKIELKEIHLGGGTPTFLPPSELEMLMEGILSSSGLADGYEFSVEADPRVTSKEHLLTLFRLGFRRLSLGVQDFDLAVQKAIHRVQSEEQVRVLVEQAREIGFTSINFDLIYGLPFQTEESIRRTAEIVLALRPDRIAYYGYAHVPWVKPAQRRFSDADLPTGAKKRVLYELGRNAFEGGSYREIGMDHFALETDSLWKATISGELHRNFMGYLHRRVSPVIALGVSSIGDSWTMFAQNEKHLEAYYERVRQGHLPIVRGHILTSEDQILRQHILNLMTRFETNWDKADQSCAFLETISDRLQSLVEDRLVRLEGKSCKILEAGRPFFRNVCMAFDAHFFRNKSEKPLFSKTV